MSWRLIKSFLIFYIFTFIPLYLGFNILTENPSKCSENWKDCTSWTRNSTPKGCYMYDTEECKEFNFITWTNNRQSVVLQEKDAEFGVLVYFYVIYLENNYIPSFNITLMSNSPDITGFTVLLSELNGSYNSCRIFDFRKSAGLIVTPFSLSYECYIHMDSDGFYYYLLKVQSLPNNKQLQYYINIPHVTKNIFCDTEMTIMIDIGGLADNNIHIKFLKIPNNWNVSEYKVELKQTADGSTVKTKLINNDDADHNDFISTSFWKIDKGEYFITVKSLKYGIEECGNTKTYKFFIPNSLYISYQYIIWIMVTIILGVIVVAILYLIYKRIKKKLLNSKPKAFFVYYSDSKEHTDVIVHFTKYLQNCCSVQTFLDILHFKEGDPTDWILNCFSEANVIVLVLSNNMNDGMIDQNCYCRPSISPLCDNFPCYWTIIKSELNKSNKKFVKIYFDYFDKECQPKLLKESMFGEEFHLMKDLKKFVCHLFDINTVFKWLIPFPQIPKILFNAIEKVKKTEM